jgi:methylamine dehydrogenase light chain
MKIIDRWVEHRARNLAQTFSRRSFLNRLGTIIVGGSTIPLLPVARADTNERPQVPDDSKIVGDAGDPTKCEYWRNCAMDGFMCGHCGGSTTSCPPGTEFSPITWIGTCRNPVDNKDYIISYNDCCGKSSCNRRRCNRNEGDKPNYLSAKSNDIIWCMGTSNNIYHCTVTLVLGVAVDS